MNNPHTFEREMAWKKVLKVMNSDITEEEFDALLKKYEYWKFAEEHWPSLRDIKNNPGLTPLHD